MVAPLSKWRSCPHFRVTRLRGGSYDDTVALMWNDVAGLPPFRRDQAPDWLTDAHIRRALRAGDLVAGRRGVLLGRRRCDDPWNEHALATEIAIAGMRGAPA